MGVWGLRFRLNQLWWRRTRRKSKTLRRKTMAKTKPTPRRMRRRNPQAIRAPAHGSRTVIITTTPDDITADTADITTAGITAGKSSAPRYYIFGDLSPGGTGFPAPEHRSRDGSRLPFFAAS